MKKEEEETPRGEETRAAPGPRWQGTGRGGKTNRVGTEEERTREKERNRGDETCSETTMAMHTVCIASMAAQLEERRKRAREQGEERLWCIVEAQREGVVRKGQAREQTGAGGSGR